MRYTGKLVTVDPLGRLLDGTPMHIGDPVEYLTVRGGRALGRIEGFTGGVGPVVRVTGKKSGAFGYYVGDTFEANLLWLSRRKVR